MSIYSNRNSFQTDVVRPHFTVKSGYCKIVGRFRRALGMVHRRNKALRNKSRAIACCKSMKTVTNQPKKRGRKPTGRVTTTKTFRLEESISTRLALAADGEHNQTKLVEAALDKELPQLPAVCL